MSGKLIRFPRRKTLKPDEAEAAQRRGDLQIVDVREPAEVIQASVYGAAHIPLRELYRRLGELDRTLPVAFLCASGNRSAMATRVAGKAGLDASNIEGGLAAWVRAGLPVITATPRGAA